MVRPAARNPESCLPAYRPPGSGIKKPAARGCGARCYNLARIVYAERVEARSDYLARLRLADLALDPFPYNSHSTGMDALWAGVPMVALLGQTFAGRVGASMLVAARIAGMRRALRRSICNCASISRATPTGCRRSASALPRPVVLHRF